MRNNYKIIRRKITTKNNTKQQTMDTNLTLALNMTTLGPCQTKFKPYLDRFDNEPDCIRITTEWAEVVSFQCTILGYLGITLVILGLIGNILSLIVLSHKAMRSTTSAHLFALALFDSLVLISMFLFVSLPELSDRYMALFGYIRPFAYPFVLVSQTCSVYTTVALTIDRYIAVCHPLRAVQSCTRNRTRQSLALIALFSLLFNIPRMLETHWTLSSENIVHWELTDFGNNTIYRHVYLIVLHISVMVLIPFIVLLILNTKLVVSVRKSRHIRGTTGLGRQTQNERNLTAMLTMVVAVFLLCQLPSILDNILGVVLTEEEALKPFPLKVNAINNLCVMINSAVNFYMYCLFGKKFRRAFATIIMKRDRSRRCPRTNCSTIRAHNGSQKHMLLKIKENQAGEAT